MNDETKCALIITLGVLLFFGMIVWSHSYEIKLKTEQPKYFINLDNKVYELKEVE